MEFNKKEVSIVNDDPCEGKPFVTPQCINCVNNENCFCKIFNKRRLEIIADGDTDIFNCEKFVSKY